MHRASMQMKIIHTGDLHLIKEVDQRWGALVEVISQAKQETAEVLIISGDLFDSDADAEALRIPLRAVFEEAEFETLIIPGNHDAALTEPGVEGLEPGRQVGLVVARSAQPRPRARPLS